MWIFTDYGVFMPALRPPETVVEGDEQLLQVRARRRVDLARLRRQHMPTLGRTYAIPGTDYEYRANCTHEELAVALAALARDIDYVKFKPTTDRWKDDQLHAVYLNVWALLLRDLRERRRGRRRRLETLTGPETERWPNS